MIPGEYRLGEGPVSYNEGYEAIELEVTNVGDRAVQVGSQFHFFEANERGVGGDGCKAYGKRLDIPAGTAVRFEPGQTRTVRLIDLGGRRRVFGFNDKVNGYLDTHQSEGVQK